MIQRFMGWEVGDSKCRFAKLSQQQASKDSRDGDTYLGLAIDIDVIVKGLNFVAKLHRNPWFAEESFSSEDGQVQS